MPLFTASSSVLVETLSEQVILEQDALAPPQTLLNQQPIHAKQVLPVLMLLDSVLLEHSSLLLQA